MWRLAVLLALVGCPSQVDDVRVVPNTDSDPIYEGVMELSPSDELLIAGAVVGERTNGIVTITNAGEFPLSLKSAALTDDSGGALVTDEQTNADRSIAVGASYEVIIVCTLPSAEEITGVLRVESGDPDEPVGEVLIRCNTDA